MRRFLLTLIPLTLLAAAPAASATLRVDGRGWGHGIGLSQYGAYGYARDAGRGHAWILQHYYPGTTLARSGAGAVRVRLTSSRRPAFCGATRVRAASGRRVRLSDTHVYRFTRAGGDYVVRGLTTRRKRARVAAPARVTGGASWCLRGRADNGVRDGAYRGTAQLLRTGRRGVLVVDRVGIEDYLRGVVPAEM